MTDFRHEASFRDPSGFIFTREGELYRQVNLIYRENYDLLKSSGLYKELVDAGLLIAHEEVAIDPAAPDTACRVIKPETVPFISYPYEWSFSQLSDAALTTLEIHKRALKHGMILKDASAYNIQYVGCRPIMIDTLSFDRYEEGLPWVAYQQFCQHFLAPLALMSYTDIRLGQLLRLHIDGIPLDLASTLLPRKSWLSFALTAHIHLHAKSQKKYADKPQKPTGRTMNKQGLLGLIDNLEAIVRKLSWQPANTTWGEYYDDTNYDDEAMRHKGELVDQYLTELKPSSVWDLGGNTGRFSRLASDKGIPTVSFDIDPAAVEINYREGKAKAEKDILPLILDLTNPSPGLGWNHRERMSLARRGPTDTILALALIHHLAIGNNVPFEQMADFFGNLCRSLIIEFVPKEDSQVQRLLASREDVFDSYTKNDFESIFSQSFTIDQRLDIRGSKRTLYLMHKRNQ